MPGYFLNRQDDAHAIIHEVGEGNLRVQADLYHMQITEGDLSTQLRSGIGRIGHIQIVGVPDRGEPDMGEVCFDHVFRLLDELGYEGWVGCEYRPRGRTEDGLAWFVKERARSSQSRT